MICQATSEPARDSQRLGPGWCTAIFSILLLLAGVGCAAEELSHAPEAASRTPLDFSLPRLDSGEMVDGRRYAGNPVVVNFWASWCAPCRAEAPFLEASWQKYRKRGLVVIGIATLDQPKSAQEFAAAVGLTFENLLDADGAVAESFDVFSLPATVFLNREGELVKTHPGAFLSAEDQGAFEDEVEKLLEGRPPQGAREAGGRSDN